MPHPISTSMLRFDTLHTTNMKQRLFSTFRYLQHENPLVSLRCLGMSIANSYDRVCHKEAQFHECKEACLKGARLETFRR